MHIARKSFVCPCCNKKTDIVDAKYVSQRGKKISSEVHYKSALLSGHYEITNTYELYKIRVCKQCKRNFERIVYCTFIIPILGTPIVAFLLKGFSFLNLVCGVVLGGIISVVIAYFVSFITDIDIKDAEKKGAVVHMFDSDWNKE